MPHQARNTVTLIARQCAEVHRLLQLHINGLPGGGPQEAVLRWSPSAIYVQHLQWRNVPVHL